MSQLRSARNGCLLFACMFVLAGCQKKPATEQAPAATAAPKPVTAWTKYRDQYIEEYFKAHPGAGISAGRHEFDGQLPDWSKDAIAREIARLHAARDKTAALDASTVSDAERFERDYLVARIDRDLFWLETAEAPFRNPVFYIDGTIDGLDPSVYLTRNYAPLDQRMRAYTAYARAIPKAVEQITANLKLPIARPLLERAIAGFKGFADFYRDDVPRVFTLVSDAQLQADFKQANSDAEAAMRKLAGWLEANRGAAPQQGFALGADKYAKMLLATEGVTTPIDELEKVGRADLERNLTALKDACEKFLPGKPIPDCIGKMSDNKPEGGSVKGARAQLAGLKSFLEEHGIVTIPGTEEALVNESPPYARANSAYIDIPGPYEKGLPAIYYISPPDPSWSAAEQKAYLPGRADLLFTSVHEVWPGHFLQFLHSNRNDSLIGRLFVGYAFAEGWAHYSEEMMWDVGLKIKSDDAAGDPETHVGQLGNALLRNVRFLSSIGMHARNMSLAESEKMFREKAFTDVGTARQQAARGTFDPAYLNYTMGKLMIKKLRDDWSASRGGRAAWRDFHDKFLTYGGPPIPMVRAAMLGTSEGSLF